MGVRLPRLHLSSSRRAEALQAHPCGAATGERGIMNDIIEGVFGLIGLLFVLFVYVALPILAGIWLIRQIF